MQDKISISNVIIALPKVIKTETRPIPSPLSQLQVLSKFSLFFLPSFVYAGVLYSIIYFYLPLRGCGVNSSIALALQEEKAKARIF